MFRLSFGGIALGFLSGLAVASAGAIPALHSPKMLGDKGAGSVTVLVSDERDREIYEKLQVLVAELLALPVEDVRMDSSFSEDLNADELDIVELAIATEEEFDVELSDSVLDGLDTVGDLVAAIVKLSD